MRYGLIDITDLIFDFSDETKKNSSAKKNGRKTTKFSESAGFLPVGQPRSNKQLFIFGNIIKSEL